MFAPVEPPCTGKSAHGGSNPGARKDRAEIGQEGGPHAIFCGIAVRNRCTDPQCMREQRPPLEGRKDRELYRLGQHQNGGAEEDVCHFVGTFTEDEQKKLHHRPRWSAVLLLASEAPGTALARGAGRFAVAHPMCAPVRICAGVRLVRPPHPPFLYHGHRRFVYLTGMQ